MPKAIALDGDKPRRRRAAAVEAEETTKRGLAMRILLYSPKDLAAAATAFAAVGAIMVNALFLQAGRHPSPMFGGNAAAPTVTSALPNPLPRPRPIEADARPLETKSVETQPVEVKAAAPRPAEVEPSEVKSSAHPVKTTLAPAAAAANVMRPPAPIPQSSRNDPVGELIVASHRVAAVQRALTEYGYGQLKPTGVVGSDTQAAIQKFERDRKMPVTGQMSDRLARELAAMTGRSIE